MRRSMARRGAVVLLSVGLAGVPAACAPGIGNAIAVDQYVEPPGGDTNEYIIKTGDVLTISVWEQANLSGQQVVLPDGRINIPLINEIQAAGKTPSKLQSDIEAALKEIVINPRVTVHVQNPKLPTISVMGEVGKQGAIDLTSGMGVAEAIAAAGGLSTFAHKDRIFVQRPTAQGPVRIHFTYEALLEGTGKAAQFKLRPGDTIVVR